MTKKGSTVEYKGTINKKATSITIPSTVKLKGVTYKVTSIAKNAFINNKKLKKVTISSNITKIGSKAFTKAGSSNYKKLSVKVPSSKYKTYKKLLKKKGLSSKAKVKK